jgi:hypothetical protein
VRKEISVVEAILFLVFCYGIPSKPREVLVWVGEGVPLGAQGIWVLCAEAEGFEEGNGGEMDCMKLAAFLPRPTLLPGIDPQGQIIQNHALWDQKSIIYLLIFETDGPF